MTESMSISPGAVTDVVRAVDGDGEIEVSVVMPCLNEADTLATCIEKAQRALDASTASHGEIIVADNGSTDGSQRDRRATAARASCPSRRRATATR